MRVSVSACFCEPLSSQAVRGEERRGRPACKPIKAESQQFHVWDFCAPTCCDKVQGMYAKINTDHPGSHSPSCPRDAQLRGWLLFIARRNSPAMTLLSSVNLVTGHKRWPDTLISMKGNLCDCIFILKEAAAAVTLSIRFLAAHPACSACYHHNLHQVSTINIVQPIELKALYESIKPTWLD